MIQHPKQTKIEAAIAGAEPIPRGADRPSRHVSLIGTDSASTLLSRLGLS